MDLNPLLVGIYLLIQCLSVTPMQLLLANIATTALISSPYQWTSLHITVGEGQSVYSGFPC